MLFLFNTLEPWLTTARYYAHPVLRPPPRNCDHLVPVPKILKTIFALRNQNQLTELQN